MTNLCTLFDYNYMDRGIALYQSLKKYAADFRLYILCMDQMTYDTLNLLHFNEVVLITEEAVQNYNKVLINLKEQRKRAEYCWTSTPILIKYILDQYKVGDCTYIDADMMFYGDPQRLLDELYSSGASVGIIGHRFPNNIAKKKREKYYGKYCVEFNTFVNDSRGRAVLNDWEMKCINQCTMDIGEKVYGDQKYLEEWEYKYEGIYEYQNLGAGVAPWNICKYRPCLLGEKVCLTSGKEKCELLFYHFQSLAVLEEAIYIGVYNELGVKSRRLIDFLYYDYAYKLINIRKQLELSGIVLPKQVMRRGEREAVKKMNIVEFLIFCYQCIPGIVEGRRNYLSIEQIRRYNEKQC